MTWSLESHVNIYLMDQSRPRPSVGSPVRPGVEGRLLLPRTVRLPHRGLLDDPGEAAAGDVPPLVLERHSLSPSPALTGGGQLLS